MRNHPNLKAEKFRDHRMPQSSAASGTNAGAFSVPYKNLTLCCIVSDGAGWDHVSVHVYESKRCPTWEEMCFIKDLFFKDEEAVMQLHPAKSQHINNHPFTLHLWRPQSEEELDRLTAEFGVDLLGDAVPGPIPLPFVEMV